MKTLQKTKTQVLADRLIKIYGNKHKAAQRLGITDRHFYRIYSEGYEPSLSIIYLMDELVRKYHNNLRRELDATAGTGTDHDLGGS